MSHVRRACAYLVFFLVFLACSGCTSLQAGSDYYDAASFSAYRSFAWVGDSPMIQSRSRVVDINPLNVRRIREAIERELEAKGFAQVETDEAADFGISFTVGARDMIRVDDYPSFYRGRWRWNPPYYWPNVDVSMYTEGMLAIDVFDNTTREPVWHGWARKRIVGSDIDDPRSTIDAAVAAILEDFPP